MNKFRQIRKRQAALALAVILGFSGMTTNVAYGLDGTDTEDTQEAVLDMTDRTGGYLEPEVTELSMTDEEMAAMAEGEPEDATGAMEVSSEWDVYSSNYYYNQLSDGLKATYDGLYASALAYMEGTESGTYIWGDVPSGALKTSEVMEMINIFRLSNPQFYFLMSAGSYYIYYENNQSTGYCSRLGIKIYQDFQSGTARQTATAALKSKLTDWNAQIAVGSTELEKEKIAHDLIVENVAYNYTVLEGDNTITNAEEESYYTQSAYSSFMLGTTVCAGYAQAFTMLCNAAGIDCTSVTSSNHQWNKVRIEDSWYNLDCTWDDPDSGTVYYRYFNRSEAAMQTMDTSAHVESSSWSEYLPSCTLDSGAGYYYSTVSMPSITVTTAAPAIAYTDNNGVLTVTLSSTTSGASIYYLTSTGTGTTEPSVAYTKSAKYAGTFTVESGTTVKAIAVKDTYYDSSVTAQTLMTQTAGDESDVESGDEDAADTSEDEKSESEDTDQDNDADTDDTVVLVNAVAPVIASQPTAASYALKAATKALTVKASVTDGGKLSYQWYKNAKNAVSGGTKISGATGASYTPSSAAAGTIYYYCVITNTNSSATGTKTASTTSRTAKVTIAKASQSIKASNVTKTYAKNATVKLAVSRKTGNGAISYYSSNKAVVTVSSKGVLTIKGTGKATITIKAAATSNYNAYLKKITVTIKPKKETISKVSSTKAKTLTVTWKKDTTVTGYQIQYSLKSNFKNAKTVTIGKNSTTSRKLTGLTAKKKYYVRIRGYKTVSGTKLYGAWSSTKSVTVKK